ncbi:uncharacterized protein LOC9635371 [Selaginella moellendorffii]|uniref:uncharacterized protein LOC9635371 n=1 Tax=Selaginella moellendorffii TaxID=88036 RepID=UPI000D1CE9F0|nr:uncharacterized protein LOC9635371 [Selaginella moellendorffii]XP_024527601.1 uncharacterized protein LOC9635371 [Selaginella moellendorffii]XP_024527602.1 uncharacterized protein LOC9635371 [Selaginella moellendorffii]|eukprot:XP_024527600.1 uncharacterized protein LOC9635371 [Selaginella moellendorffii]
MAYSYAEDWIKMNQYHQHDHGFIKPQFVPPRSTKTVEVRSGSCYQKYNPPPEKERFVMSKFKAVHHKIDNVQTTPLLRDERPSVFQTTSRGGVHGAQGALRYCGDGDDYPSCGVAGIRTRLPCSGISPLLPRRNDADVVCVADQPPGRVLLPRFYKACSSNPANPCASHPRRSDPDEAVTTVRREVTLRGPRRSDPD